ncbi:MAG: hypothetical protein A3208_02935 [Candidatus Methanoprimaticola hominis]|nr:MAG: hypothetical protein A3208_02935 [Methanomassiliicoccales archaeon Mx-06]
MNGRKMVLIAVAIMGLVCFAPLIAEDSSAETVDTRISSMYVFEAKTTIRADAIPAERDYFTYYMIEGGSNWKGMTEYLKDPQNSPGVNGDDFGVLKDNVGKTVHLYGMRNYSDNEYLWFGNYSFPCTKVLDPYNIPRIVADKDDVVRIEVGSATSNEGVERDGVYLYRHGTDSGYDYLFLDRAYRFVWSDGDSYSIRPTWSDDQLYWDLEYDVEVRSPNGSATAFAAVCMIISALTIITMVVAVMKPRWAK